MMSLRSIYLTCALLALFAVPAFCTPIFYTDRTTWLTAVTSPTTLTFDGAGSAVGDYSTAAGFTTGLVLPDNPTFVGLTNVTYNLTIRDYTSIPSYNYGSGDSLWWSAMGVNNVTSSWLHITWPTTVTAVAVDFMTYAGSSTGYNVRINGDPTQVYTSGPTTGWPDHTFFGLTSDTAITSIDFYLPAGATAWPLIDNFSYGTAGAASPGDTPEVGTFLSISSGLIGLALMGRRFRRSGTPAV